MEKLAPAWSLLFQDVKEDLENTPNVKRKFTYAWASAS